MSQLMTDRPAFSALQLSFQAVLAETWFQDVLHVVGMVGVHPFSGGHHDLKFFP
jgi:hypothetical protein